MKPDIDSWLPNPGLRVEHRRECAVAPARRWEAARRVRLSDAGRLGRLIGWRIPGTRADVSFDELFQNPPFMVLDGDRDRALVSGLVGRIWTLRRDYPELSDPQEFKSWNARGTARVTFANWIEQVSDDRSALVSEVRVDAIGSQGRLGVAAVRPLVSAFHSLIGSEGIAAAVTLAERDGRIAHR